MYLLWNFKSLIFIYHSPTFIYLGELESKLQDTETVLQEVRIAWVPSSKNLILLSFILFPLNLRLKSRMSDCELCPLE